jgi:hypothetical protein
VSGTVLPTNEPRFSIDPTGHHRIDFAARPRLITIAFALLWLSGWLLLLILLSWTTSGLDG